MPLTESQERYVNFYTDFAFKNQAEIAMFTPQERLCYEESLKDYRDVYSVMKTQLDKGIKKGIEEERKKNAKGFKSKGVDINTISEVTGLSIEEISKL